MTIVAAAFLLGLIINILLITRHEARGLTNSHHVAGTYSENKRLFCRDDFPVFVVFHLENYLRLRKKNRFGGKRRFFIVEGESLFAERIEYTIAILCFRRGQDIVLLSPDSQRLDSGLFWPVFSCASPYFYGTAFVFGNLGNRIKGRVGQKVYGSFSKMKSGKYNFLRNSIGNLRFQFLLDPRRDVISTLSLFLMPSCFASSGWISSSASGSLPLQNADTTGHGAGVVMIVDASCGQHKIVFLIRHFRRWFEFTGHKCSQPFAEFILMQKRGARMFLSGTGPLQSIAFA